MNIWLIVSFNMTFLIEQLVLIVATKLEHIIMKMADELTNSTMLAQVLPNVMLGNKLFWFKRPRLIIKCIHFILFQVNFYVMSMYVYVCKKQLRVAQTFGV